MFQRLTNEDDGRDPTRRSGVRAYDALRRAVWLARRAIIAAKLRRLRGELMGQAGLSVDAYATPIADAVRRPQAPLILGDKWDF